MVYFDFRRLINKYISTFEAVLLTGGYFDDVGEWVEADKETITMYGAVISYRESKVYRSEGTLTAKDKRLFMLMPLDDKLHGAKVVYEGDVYSVEDATDNAKFTGVWAYTMKYVSAFKEKSPSYDATEEIDQLEQRLDGVLLADEPDTPVVETSDAELLRKRLDGV